MRWARRLTQRYRLARQIKANPISRLLVLATGNFPLWAPKDYRQMAERGYLLNAAVFACVTVISQACSGIPWLLYQKSRTRSRMRSEIENHPLLDLIERPNPEKGQGAFIIEAMAYLLIAGNSLTVLARPRPSEPPMELWILPPFRERFQILPDLRDRIAGYQYTVDGRTPQIFERRDLLHRKFFHPTDDWWGLSPIQVAARAIDSDNAAQQWNFNLLKNEARPSGALVTPEQLSNQAYERLKAELDESYTGMENIGRPMLLEAGIDWKPFSITPKDMDWLQGRRASQRDICVIYRVAPELIGDAENKTYANMAEARRALYEERVLPEMDALRDDLNNWLAPQFGDRLWLDYDRDSIEALRENQDSLWARLNAATDLTVNEKRQARGYEPIPGGDVLLIPSGLIPVPTDDLLSLPEPAIEPDDEPNDEPAAQDDNPADSPQDERTAASQGDDRGSGKIVALRRSGAA